MSNSIYLQFFYYSTTWYIAVMQKKVLLIGGGGREHALAWKIAQSPRLEKLYIAPGNAGTEHIGENVRIAASDIKELIAFAKEKQIDFVVVGPDDPLALGIVDAFKAEGILIFGPTKEAAKLEWSKAHAKDFMARHNIPTAYAETFTDFEDAVAYIDKEVYPLVIKASGLALGKGVVTVQTRHEALETLRQMMVQKVFGDAGSEVVIEEYLQGVEISIHAFSDGKTVRLFPSSQDHKRAHDNDEGLNTGGMGTISPLPFVSLELLAQIDREIVTPTIQGMADEGHPFVGILYPGIMLTKDGPKVFEFNVRFGDPETQSYMRLLDTDILEILEACATGTLDTVDIHWKHGAACTVVVASAGYPSAYEKGQVIEDAEAADEVSDVVVFHAGTKIIANELTVSGGRVLGVSAFAATLPEAIRKAYEGVNKINFTGKQYRTDIGKKALITKLP